MSKLRRPSFAILLYRSKKLGTGEHPIMIRATFNRRQKYYALGLSTIDEFWNDELCLIQPLTRKLTEQEKASNTRLMFHLRELDKLKQYFEEVDFTFDRFEAKMFPDNTQSSVFVFIQAIIDQLIADGRVGTAFTYKDTLKRIRDFRRQKDLSFRDIDLQFLEGLKKHIRKTNGVNSTGIYLRTFKAIYNRAVIANLVRPDLSPFKGWRIETESTRKRSLTSKEIDALKSYQAPAGTSEFQSLNYFLFSYYCRGMNFGDIVRLTWSDIRNGRLFYQRKKTKDPFDIPIDARVAEILAQCTKGDDYIFPVLQKGLSELTIKHRIKRHLKNVNNDLQALAAKIGLPNDITFYWARHTFATRLKRSGVATNLISEVLGHSSEKVTKAYLDSFDTIQLDAISEFL